MYPIFPEVLVSFWSDGEGCVAALSWAPMSVGTRGCLCPSPRQGSPVMRLFARSYCLASNCRTGWTDEARSRCGQTRMGEREAASFEVEVGTRVAVVARLVFHPRDRKAFLFLRGCRRRGARKKKFPGGYERGGSD